MAEPGTGAANGQDHFFLQGWDGFCSYRTSGPTQAEGTKTHATSLQHAIPGSAMLLHLLDQVSTREEYAGGLSGSGASPPYQRCRGLMWLGRSANIYHNVTYLP